MAKGDLGDRQAAAEDFERACQLNSANRNPDVEKFIREHLGREPTWTQ
jgi:hypothetical protein